MIAPMPLTAGGSLRRLRRFFRTPKGLLLVILAAITALGVPQVGADVAFDHITVGTADCRGHFGPCGADIDALQRFLG